jgi:galactose mutarotase-like enzyme
MAEISTIGQIGGAEVHQATLTGPDGLRVVLLTYGARLAQLWVPDRGGALADIVLGHDSLAGWQTLGSYVGATCGRYANRIAKGRFPLDGRTIQLDRNEGANHLHGGAAGLDRKLWQIESHSVTHVTFRTASPDGEMGYPGTLQLRATYRIDQGLVIEMEATTDAPTIVNLVNHAYFNLAGQGAGNILGQHLQVEAGFYLPVDSQLIPTGEVASVTDTPFDFRQPRVIGLALPGPGGFDAPVLSPPILPPGGGCACRRRNPESSSTPGPISTTRPARRVPAIRVSAASRWKPSASLIRRTPRISPRPGSIPARPTGTSCASTSLRRQAEPSVAPPCRNAARRAVPEGLGAQENTPPPMQPQHPAHRGTPIREHKSCI